MSAIVTIENAFVTYKVRHGASPTLKETFINAVKRRAHDVEIAALQGISVNINRGEILAIIGNNGAGKSTLLKLIARVLPPTQGRVIVHGRVSPMIELSAGFNPELTGRENVILYGTLLGRRPKDMELRADAIAEWAGVKGSIDLPVRTYSSGMIARLAFSVATDDNADLILIDEVLSVGDAEFQSKSKTRMNRLLGSGAAVVLVTHDLETVRTIATKALWINRGKVQAYGQPSEVINFYLNA